MNKFIPADQWPWPLDKTWTAAGESYTAGGLLDAHAKLDGTWEGERRAAQALGCRHGGYVWSSAMQRLKRAGLARYIYTKPKGRRAWMHFFPLSDA